jgi:D-sedoheptulose 7-phosphate isomerase
LKSRITDFLDNSIEAINSLSTDEIEKFITTIREIQLQKGRIFIMGVGGSAANASHAVNDFRKLCNIEAYCVSDNVSELTARINDESWELSYKNYLKNCNLNSKDGLMFFSVGGGSLEKNISTNLIKAAQFGSEKGCKILAIVGKKDGYLYSNSTSKILISSPQSSEITPLTESITVLLWHLMVSHDSLKVNETTW